VIPGLGQLFNGRRGLAALFVIPSLLLIVVAFLLVRSQSPAQLAAWVISPQVLGALLTLNVLVLVWRLVAVGQAFLDTRRTGPTGWLGIGGITIIGLLVVLPHLAVWRYGTIVGETFDKIFSGGVLGATSPGASPGPGPREGERVNVLLVGTDKRAKQTENLTDTMMVASLDPVGKSVSLVSIPRDMVDTPLGNGDTFGPKLNSLMSYADRNKDQFPKGGMRTLEDAVGALLGIRIDYFAQIDFPGFIKIVDAVGGVDVTVARGFDDPTYDGYSIGERGFSITAGKHHLDGATALAYARSRKALGESDFTRQARQQQVIVALRDRVSQGGSLLFQLPGLLDAVGQTIRTDMPVGRLPALAAIVDEVGKHDVTSVVIQAPLVKPVNTPFGSSQEPNLAKIRAMAAALFPAPGGDPVPWPTPTPTKAPKAKTTARPS
jgi:polyisoprenyl-teichoic acid--peptidoglycan teichoic acid transferase